MIDLNDKKFPDREKVLEMKRKGGKIASSAYATFVREGSLYVRSVNSNRQIRDIDFYSSNITALTYYKGFLFGATSGEKSVVFEQVLNSAYDVAAPVLELENGNETKGIAVRDMILYLGSNKEGKGNIIEVKGCGGLGDVIQEWGYPIPEEKLLLSLDEKILSFVQSRKNNDTVYIITESGKFLTYSIKDCKTEEKGIISENFFSPCVCEDSDGNVYLFRELGEMLVFSDGELKETGISVSCYPGKGPYAKISACIYSEKDNTLIVGDTEGLISIIELTPDDSKPKSYPIGKPSAVGGIDFLTEINDGRIYGSAGSKEGMAHLFLYDRKYHSLKDLGVCCATVEKGWYGYVFGAMLALPDGHIVLGEDDRLGCLFHYYPPIM